MARRHEALIPLSHDHQKALMLAFRLLHPAPPGPVTPTTPASTPERRRTETLAFFGSHLAAHFAIEEEILFPVLATTCEAQRALIDELCADHARLRGLRDEIERVSDSDTLAHALDDFGTLLERHVRREEREMFTGFPGVLSADAVEELHRRIHARRLPDQQGACKI